MDQKTKKTWISIVVAAVVIVGILAVAIVGGTAFFVYRHIDARFTDPQNADQTFTTARARFSGQQPLIEVTRGEDPVIHRERNGSPRHPINALHALVYD